MDLQIKKKDQNNSVLKFKELDIENKVIHFDSYEDGELVGGASTSLHERQINKLCQIAVVMALSNEELKHFEIELKDWYNSLITLDKNELAIKCGIDPNKQEYDNLELRLMFDRYLHMI